MTYDEDDLFHVLQQEEEEDTEVSEAIEHADIETALDDSEYEPSDAQLQEEPSDDVASETVDEPRQPMTHLPQEVNDRIAECLRYELASIDQQIAHAADIASRDHFFDRWINILETKRQHCVEALEKTEKATEVVAV